MTVVDDIWNDMQRPTTKVDRLLAKSVYNKASSSSKKKKKKKEKVVPGPAKKEEPPEKIVEAPPSSAVEVIRRLARAVSQINDGSQENRTKGLVTLTKVLERCEEWDDATLKEILKAISEPLLRRFEDFLEANRSRAIDLYTKFATKVDVHWQFLFPVLVSRCAPAVGVDETLGIFVFDVDQLEAYKRGKAQVRPDLGMAFERERVVTVREPSEEIRLQLCDLLVTVMLPTQKKIIPYFHEGLLLLAGFLRDPFPDLCVRAAEGVAQICAPNMGAMFSLALVPYASALARVCMPNLRHRTAKVRGANVQAIHRAVAVEYRAKCRGAGTEAIADLVGFREDNVIPTASFYERETRYNYLADLTRDASVIVRRKFATCIGDWFTTLPDRRDHQPRLFAFLLNFLIDDDDEVRTIAFKALETAGKEWAKEHWESDIMERQQYGVDGDARCNFEALPWPFEDRGRPALGSRLLVRAFMHRFLKPVLGELGNWRSDCRKQSALLLRVVIIYAEDVLTQELPILVVAFCRALAAIRREGYDEKDLILQGCCEALGRYVVPETFLPFLAPRITGDMDVVPNGTDAAMRADVTLILAAFLRGAKPATILSQTTPLVALLTDPVLSTTINDALASAVATALGDFLKIVEVRGRAALESVFLATGRLDKLDAAVFAILRALLSLRAVVPVDDALETLAKIDSSSVQDLILRRAPVLIDDAFDFGDVDGVAFRLVEQSLRLVTTFTDDVGRLLTASTAAFVDVTTSEVAFLRLGEALLHVLRLSGAKNNVSGAVLRDLVLFEEEEEEPNDVLAEYRRIKAALIEPCRDAIEVAGPVIEVLAASLRDDKLGRPTKKRIADDATLLTTMANVMMDKKCHKQAYASAVPFLKKEHEKNAALDVLWEIKLDDDDKDFFTEVVKSLFEFLPTTTKSDEPEDIQTPSFETKIDALLRSYAVVDPTLFMTLLSNVEQRTTAIANLEDHASLLLTLRGGGSS